MSAKGPKDCGNHSGYRRRLYRRIAAALFIFVLIVAFVILVIYLALHPHKPRFYLQDATVRELNITGGLLTSNLQFTLFSRNPNDKIGIYYDRLGAYASYGGQQITYYTDIPPFYQGHKDINVFSPILIGNSVPLAPFLAEHLNLEEQTGVVTLNVKLNGRIRWKVGTWISGHYHLNVNCYTILGLSTPVSGGQVPLQPGTRCDVDV